MTLKTCGMLCMPLPNVNMLCLLLFTLVIVLFHCRAPSPAQHALDSYFVPHPTHAEPSPGLTGASRDTTALIVTQCLGLPQLYSHPTMPLSVHYALNLIYHAQKSSPFILCSQHTRRPVLVAFTLTLLLLCSYSSVALLVRACK